MSSQKSRQEIIADHDRKTAIGSLNGNLDYPSSRGLGVDVVSYLRRNPHPTEHTPLPVQVKMRDLPYHICLDLRDAARAGELRSELNRHVDLLEKGQLADAGTIKMLRGYADELTGHPQCDAEQLDVIEAVVNSLGPKEAK